MKIDEATINLMAEFVTLCLEPGNTAKVLADPVVGTYLPALLDYVEGPEGEDTGPELLLRGSHLLRSPERFENFTDPDASVEAVVRRQTFEIGDYFPGDPLPPWVATQVKPGEPIVLNGEPFRIWVVDGIKVARHRLKGG